MFLLPIGHDHGGVRRRPWVTFGVMGVCLLILIATHGFGLDGPADEWAQRAWEAIDYWAERPYLFLDETFAEQSLGEEFYELEMLADSIPAPPPEVVTREQAELDRLVARADDALGSNPYASWGLIPDAINPFKLITHLFMHAGWLHLLGNMLMLYLAGPYIEDVWGRRVYGAFYVAAGIFAALFFVVLSPASSVPLVGASGAIAGVMGAFLIRYADTRIRFFYLIGFFIRGTFDAPAWLMLPLWLGEQLLLGMLTASGGGGVAYWAHVGGFLFGVAVAFGIKRARLEERYFDRAIESKVNETVIDNAAIDAAFEKHAAGDTQGAFEAAVACARRDPTSWDAVLAVWQISLDRGTPAEAAPYMVRLVQAELRAGDSVAALEHWEELTRHVPTPAAESAILLRLAQAADEAHRGEQMRTLLQRVVVEAGSGLTVAQALQIARLGRGSDPETARAALKIALAQPTIDPDSEAQLIDALAGLRSIGGLPVR